MKQNDISSNLEQWNRLDRYSEWMFHTYKPFIGHSVLDIGAGVGNLTKFLLDRCQCIVGVDIFEKQIKIMQKRFEKNTNFKAINWNILEDNLEDLKGYKFDTIICINVLEHLENDFLALKKMKQLLQPGGKIIILVPAIQQLYSHLDKNVGHHRRYNKGDLKKYAKKIKMNIIADKYFNFWGIVPYFLKGKFGKDQGGSFSTDLNNSNSKFYNVMSVILEPIERIVPPPIGLSEIIVLEKI